ncbi:MAG: carbamoyltransferase [Elusimicrobiota bacterium]|nr:carbamoyltransferase [Elusimicrobiota bacterium]
MDILGVSAFYHDSAAALVRDGVVVAAAQEERFTRKRHDASFPIEAVRFCLQRGGVSPKDLACVVFYDKPLLKFERILSSYLACAPAGLRSFSMAVPLWLKRKLWMKGLIRDALGYEGEILFTEHHESHAASAFYPSPFKEAAVLTMDGVGEWATASIGKGDGNRLDLLRELHFPHSLGLLYSAFTYYTGFKVNSGEYKVMGLAPYGEPKYAGLIRDKLIDLKDDGSFRMDMSYFDYAAGLTMTNAKFDALFGGPPRSPESKLGQREMDLAASIQVVCEEVMLKMARHAREVAGSRNLCLAGGVALNCVGNGAIHRAGLFDEVWIQPAAGDAGGALGGALFAWHAVHGKPRAAGPRDSQQGSVLGPSFTDDEVAAYLKSVGAPFTRVAPAEVAARAADLLAEGKVLGWFQGRMEYGPRALGARSILGGARDPKMQSVMNLKIKYRESFRPFAPAVLADKVSEWFDFDAESPYMLMTAPVKESRRLPETPEQAALFGIERLNRPRSTIPAVTHVDHSARLQTVRHEDNAPFHDLLKAFEARTGCPVLVNTSFNVRGEPIVCRPEEAYACFMRTEMDHLVIGSLFLDKAAQPKTAKDDSWKTTFALD